jgi:hypothetical protein
MSIVQKHLRADGDIAVLAAPRIWKSGSADRNEKIRRPGPEYLRQLDCFLFRTRLLAALVRQMFQQVGDAPHLYIGLSQGEHGPRSGGGILSRQVRLIGPRPDRLEPLRPTQSRGRARVVV